jgi:hypothetical protein
VERGKIVFETGPRIIRKPKRNWIRTLPRRCAKSSSGNAGLTLLAKFYVAKPVEIEK